MEHDAELGVDAHLVVAEPLVIPRGALGAAAGDRASIGRGEAGEIGGLFHQSREPAERTEEPLTQVAPRCGRAVTRVAAAHDLALAVTLIDDQRRRRTRADPIRGLIAAFGERDRRGCSITAAALRRDVVHDLEGTLAEPLL